MIKKEYFRFKSSNGENSIFGACWIPEDQPVKAVLQISHGMGEYVDRYDDFARYMCGRGFAVVGNDHLGHGDSVASKDDWGYMGKNGFAYIVKDLHKVTRHFKKIYPDVPYFLLGHSMGSFAARYYLIKYGKELNGAVIMGTAYHPVAETVFGQALARSIAAVKGWHHHSLLLILMAFGNYNKAFEPRRTDVDWLSRNEANIDKYMSEPRNGFTLTVNGFYEMFKGLQFITLKENLEKMPKDLPVFFVSGQKDPVGDMTKGVKKTFDAFSNVGMKHLDMKFYPEDRHEILMEVDKHIVYRDIAGWLEEKFI